MVDDRGAPRGEQGVPASRPADVGATDATDARPDRGRAVRHLDFIGEERESAFDDLVRLAARLCGTELAGLTVIGGERAWLKAEVGLGSCASDRVGAFTAPTLHAPGVVVVDGGSTVPGSATERFVAGDPAVRSYGGVAVRTPDGVAVGALFVASAEVRPIDDVRRTVLEGLGRQVEHLFELRAALRSSTEVNEELERSRVRLQGVLDAITQGVTVHAPDGRVVAANPAAQRILGVDLEQLHGRLPTDARWQTVHSDGTAFAPDQHPVSVTLRYRVPVNDVTFGITRPDGERRWLLVNSAPLPSPEVGFAAVSAFNDVTAVTDLNDQLHESMRELADAAQERAALLSAVSHDIRAPLASMRMMTDILSERGDEIGEERRADLLRRLRAEARRTEGVISDLVVAPRLGTVPQAPRRQLVDVAGLVRDVACDFAHDNHHLEVGELSGDLVLSADRAQIERILDNLISNAVRHTPAGSHVVVSAVERDDDVVLSVTDDGPGVSDALKARIFHAYVRGERAEQRPGSGLGLYLVQQFAQFHGGRAWCEDAPGGGTRFVVALPRPCGESTGAPSDAIAGRDG